MDRNNENAMKWLMAFSFLMVIAIISITVLPGLTNWSADLGYAIGFFIAVVAAPWTIRRAFKATAPVTTPTYVADMERDQHGAFFGTSGKGKSALLQAEAMRLGITYGELLMQTTPTPEQLALHKIRQCQEIIIEDQRLNSVREAFWRNTPIEHPDLKVLFDALVDTGIVEKPIPEQVKALFMMLPADIIGAALQWGFTDTEVRERTYEFVEQNRHTVIEAIRNAMLVK